MLEPRVYLIGAGPGDPELITIKGHRILTEADVIVFDHLVHRRMLSQVRDDAETIDVGPAAPQSLELNAISLLLAEKVREGKAVARLKWGDPFVFDSGGEEALFLHEQGISYEVVPGIPSTIGSPAYAGIPVTYPEAGDTLTLVRGDAGETSRPAKVAWSRLARIRGSIVTHGTGPQLGAMLKALQRHGRSPAEPAALIYRGTLPEQRTIEGTIAQLERRVKRREHREPAVLVVGQVTALREHLRWHDTRPLSGKRIVVTRARTQARELVSRLANLGADPIEAPTITFTTPDDPEPLASACRDIAAFDWVVFTSANAVERFIQQLLREPGDIRELHGVKLCAVGPATAEAINRHGLRTDLVPEHYRADAVATALTGLENLTDVRMLLPRADLARDLLPTRLREAGANVTSVTAYKTSPTDFDRDGAPDIYQMLLERRIDIVTFASGSSVTNFVAALGDDQARDLMQGVDIACIGPVTADVAAGFGLDVTIMPEQYTTAAMVNAIVAHIGRATSRDQV